MVQIPEVVTYENAVRFLFVMQCDVRTPNEQQTNLRVNVRKQGLGLCRSSGRAFRRQIYLPFLRDMVIHLLRFYADHFVEPGSMHEESFAVH